jgi:hypothetical protein
MTMDSALLKKLFGSTPTWHGPCVVFVDADTSVKASGQDSIVAGGTKSYAPRITSGRVAGDAVCYHPESNALLVVQRARTRMSTGEDVLQQTLMVFDTNHVVGVEFENLDRLSRLGLTAPPLPEKPLYTAGMLVG